MDVTQVSYRPTGPLRAAQTPVAPEPAPSDRYEGPSAMDTLKNMAGVALFGAGPALAAAQWGLPGAAVGVAASMGLMWMMNRDRDIMVPFTGLTSAVMTVPALLFGWPGAVASTALCAGYGYLTR